VDSVTRFDELRAVFVNGTLSRSPGQSHTDGLIALSAGIMRRQGVEVEVVRSIDHDIAVGVYPDMTEHGWPTDAWPELYARILAADILVLCGRSGSETTARRPRRSSSGCTPARGCSTRAGRMRTTAGLAAA